ncbi:MAG: hypothetical protein II943_04190 [Victivallales bacterium]|nr:hypothetical protein [Victivallales bacterium]
MIRGGSWNNNNAQNCRSANRNNNNNPSNRNNNNGFRLVCLPAPTARRSGTSAGPSPHQSRRISSGEQSPAPSGVSSRCPANPTDGGFAFHSSQNTPIHHRHA